MLTRHNPVWEYILIRVLEESSIRPSDDMMLRSSFYYTTNDRFQCEQKVDRYYKLNMDRKRMAPDRAMEEAEKMVEAQNSCDSVRDTAMYEIDGYSFNTCVCNFIHPEFNFFIGLFGEYDKHGTLPFPGSLADQPAYIMDVLQLIRSLKLEKEAEDRERMERQQKARR